MVIFRFFLRLSCYDLPYQIQHGLANIVKYELALLSLATPKRRAGVSKAGPY